LFELAAVQVRQLHFFADYLVKVALKLSAARNTIPIKSRKISRKTKKTSIQERNSSARFPSGKNGKVF
jgi:hypothetical protein